MKIFFLFTMSLLTCLALTPVASINAQSVSESHKEWTRVYLPSFPRSGNHWIRSLVEEASGIATSSVKRDRHPKHLFEAFPWGGYCPDHGYTGIRRYPIKNDIVLIKTHFPASKRASIFDGLPYKKVVRLIRHPVDSFYSEYIRITSLHGGTAKDKVPHETVEELIELWVKFQSYWDNQENVVTLRYEDFLLNPEDNLRIILNVMNYNVEDSDIKRAVMTYPPEGFMLKHKSRFEPNDLELIEERLKEYLIYYHYPIGET